MKKVTIYGGRRDGEELEVADHVHEVVFAIDPQGTSLKDYKYSPELAEQKVNKIAVSIQRRSNGKLFIQWPKDVN